MLASAPLWQNSRMFPVLPIAGWFPSLPAPWDLSLFLLALASLALSCWRYRLGVGLFLASSLFLALVDQSRWQPWFYMYWVMLLLTLTRDTTAIAACRVALSAVYFWSGVQKFNSQYFDLVVPWFVTPAAGWLPGFAATASQWAVAAAPGIEILIGIGLWFSRTRFIAVIAACTVHLSALIFLGPLGHQHNWIIWPWNLVMPALVIILFPHSSLGEFWGTLRRNQWVAAALGLFYL